MKYQYKIEKLEDNVEMKMNKLGREGWKLIHYALHSIFMKEIGGEKVKKTKLPKADFSNWGSKKRSIIKKGVKKWKD